MHKEWILASFISVHIQLLNKQTRETRDICKRANHVYVCMHVSGINPPGFQWFSWMDGWMDVYINWLRTSEIWTSQLHQSGYVATPLPVLNDPGSPLPQEAYEIVTFLKTCRTPSEKLHIASLEWHARSRQKTGQETLAIRAIIAHPESGGQHPSAAVSLRLL